MNPRTSGFAVSALRTTLLASAVSAVIALSGCSGNPLKSSEGAEAPDKPMAAVQSVIGVSAYQIQPGDKLEISVYGEDELQKEITVGPGGGINFPLIGDLNARGKTVDQLREEVRGQLSTFIPEASVSVSIKEVVGNKVSVLGQVSDPGEYVLSGTTDVLQALSMAGGITAFAATKKVKILRRDQRTGQQTVIPFNYSDVIKGVSLEQNILLKSGDTVVVP